MRVKKCACRGSMHDMGCRVLDGGNRKSSLESWASTRSGGTMVLVEQRRVGSVVGGNVGVLVKKKKWKGIAVKVFIVCFGGLLVWYYWTSFS
jgi:hypothetical protein